MRYDELRRLARSLLRGERSHHTLQPTALVHEAYLRLIDESQLAAGSDREARARFLGLAATAMRRTLIEHARSRLAKKRGGVRQRVELDENVLQSPIPDQTLLDIDQAIDKLRAINPDLARLAELRLFAGLSMREVATVLGQSQTTAKDNWALTRAWLSRLLQPHREAPSPAGRCCQCADHRTGYRADGKDGGGDGGHQRARHHGAGTGSRSGMPCSRETAAGILTNPGRRRMAARSGGPRPRVGVQILAAAFGDPRGFGATGLDSRGVGADDPGMQPMRLSARTSCAALAILANAPLAPTVVAQTPQLLIDGNPAPGVSSGPTSWGRGPVDGTVNMVFDDGVNGSELWQSDGTAAGTVRITNFAGPVIFRHVSTMADLTVFIVERGQLLELWRTDGTPGGTTLLHTGTVSSGLGYPTQPVAHGRVMFFNDGYELRRTDGTVAGTFSLGVPWAGWKAALPGATLLYGHQSQELIVSDGDTATVVGNVPGNLIVTPDWGMFQATSQLTLPFTTTLTALHVPSSTPLVVPLMTGITTLPGRALLLATPTALLRWDGTGPAQQLQVWTTPANSSMPWGTKWAFAATVPGAGSELVVSDGTVAGTVVVDVVPGPAGSNAQIAVALRDRLVFWATTGSAGNEPHATDGTSAGTVQLGDLEPGSASSSFAGFTLLGERRAALAVQTTALGKEPWLTDGTVAGTALLADIRPGPPSSLITPGGFIGNIGMLAGDALVFPADDGVHGREFWVLPVPGSRTVLQRYSTRRFDAGDPVLGTAVGLRARYLQPGELGVVAVGTPLTTFVSIAPRRCVHFDPGNAVAVATIVGSATGEWGGAVVLPNVPAAVGLDLVAQALWVDAAAPLGIDSGDATWWSLGF